MASSSADLHDDDEILGKAYDGRLMRRLVKYLRPYRHQLGLAVAMLVLLTLLELAGPLIVKQAIDDAIGTRQLDRLPGHALAYLATIVAVFGLRYGQNYVLNVVGQRAMHDLRVQVYAHIQGLSLSYFDKNPVGRLLTRLTNDVDALNELLTSGGLAILSDGITVVGIAAALLVLNWRLALVTFLIIPPLLLASEWIRRGMRSSFREVRLKLARVNGLIAEYISGMIVIQLFNREAASMDRFDRENADLNRSNLRGVFYFALFWPVVGLVESVSLAAAIWFGGREVLSGVLTLGGVVAFIQYLDRFYQPVRDLSEKYNILQQAMASSERIFRILDEQPTVRDPREPRPIGPARGAVQFADVWFAYEPANWVLRGVSFLVRPGESVAIVGATGAGKTSIISLISRFYDVQRGQVLVDDVDVREFRQSDLRRQIGVVLQDPFLFAGTIAHNIRLNEASITDDDIRRAAEFVNAARFIESLEGGYDAPVRERGAGLSVGQKQLIAFARAVAFNPSMVLVLDEATSSVDTQTEWLIQQALHRLMEKRTSIIIAHRLSTIRQVDRILVMHKGQIVEEGTHETLLSRDGMYARLYELQYRDAGADRALPTGRIGRESL